MRNKQRTRFCCVFLCIFLVACTITANAADWMTVWLGGSFTTGSSVFVAEETFEANDSLLEAYLCNDVTYQWIMNGADIPGETGRFLWLQESYLNQYISVKVTAGGGSYYGVTQQYLVEQGHMCSFGTTWKTDAIMHWKECSCGSMSDEGTHSYPTEWEKNATEHWKKCQICGFKDSQESHTMGNWKIVTDPTDKAEGLQRRTCTVCGYAEEEVLPMLPHTHHFSTTYYDDAVEHWKECECGERSSVGTHTYGAWTVTQQATASQKGIREHTCTVCGLDMIEYFDYEPSDSPDEETPEESEEAEDAGEPAEDASEESGKRGGNRGKDDETDEPETDKGGKGKQDKGNDKDASEDKSGDAAEPDAETGTEQKPGFRPTLGLKQTSTPWGLIIGIAAGVVVIGGGAAIVVLKKKK